mmetsp:Transcript_700/g.1297  ORF Transcript_700/g.1297 Transcript_700/m.1297 type:complete len:417 (+) Transcript_700:57-1307(+)
MLSDPPATHTGPSSPWPSLPFHMHLGMKVLAPELRPFYVEHRPAIRTRLAELPKPAQEPLSIPWEGCTHGGRLAYAGTAVSHREAKFVRTRPHRPHLTARDMATSNRPEDDLSNPEAAAEEETLDPEAQADGTTVAEDGTAAADEQGADGHGVVDGGAEEAAQGTGFGEGTEHDAPGSKASRNASPTPNLGHFTFQPPAFGPPGFRQKWPQCCAVGPLSAWRDCSTKGRYFEVSVELRRHDFERFTGSQGKRPLLQLGVTSLPPEEGLSRPDAPYERGEHCWLMSTTGHVYCEGVPTQRLHTDWPSEPRGRGRDDLPHYPVTLRGLRLALLVTEVGSLRLFVSHSPWGRSGAWGGCDVEVATSAQETLPLPLARQVGALYPFVILGPNVSLVTLRRPTLGDGPQGLPAPTGGSAIV